MEKNQFIPFIAMPIYEYRCRSCRKLFSFLVGVAADAGEPHCPRCGGKDLVKLISKIARVKSRRATVDDLADLDKIGDIDDPKAMAQWARKMGRTLGEKTGEDYDEQVEEMFDNPEAEEEPDEKG